MIIFIFLLTMAFSVTNLLWVSPWMAILAPFSLIFLMDSHKRSFLTPIFLMLAYCLLWTFFYDADALLDIDFYRRDGNIFISWGVFLGAFVLGSGTKFTERGYRNILLTVSFILMVVLVVWIFTGQVSLRGEWGTSYLFLANNAAGGYIATICAMIVPFCWGVREDGRRKLNFVCVLSVVVLLFALWLTYSRGSLVGLILLPFWFIFCKYIKLRSIVIVITFISVLVGALSYFTRGSLGDAAGDEIRADTSIIEQYAVLGSGAKAANVATRVNHLWSGGFACFWASPIIGVGFGAFDDRPWDFKGIDHMFSVNKSGFFIHSDAHAHNSYVHFIAEGGLVMILLLVWVVSAIERVCRHANNVISKSVMAGLFCIVIASASEHRFVTPSQMIPFCIMAGGACAHFAKMNAVKGKKIVVSDN
jgi:O-antigen ligase